MGVHSWSIMVVRSNGGAAPKPTRWRGNYQIGVALKSPRAARPRGSFRSAAAAPDAYRQYTARARLCARGTAHASLRPHAAREGRSCCAAQQFFRARRSGALRRAPSARAVRAANYQGAALRYERRRKGAAARVRAHVDLLGRRAVARGATAMALQAPHKTATRTGAYTELNGAATCRPRVSALLRGEHDGGGA